MSMFQKFVDEMTAFIVTLLGTIVGFILFASFDDLILQSLYDLTLNNITTDDNGTSTTADDTTVLVETPFSSLFDPTGNGGAILYGIVVILFVIVNLFGLIVSVRGMRRRR